MLLNVFFPVSEKWSVLVFNRTAQTHERTQLSTIWVKNHQEVIVSMTES